MNSEVASICGSLATLAVAIPTRNRPDDLGITIDSVFRQTILPVQLIIVDQSTADESRRRVIRRYSALRENLKQRLQLVYVSDRSLNGAAAARNRALKDVKAQIVLFLDDDVVLEDDFNQRILEAYCDHPEAAGISGIITNYAPLPALFRCWARTFARGPFKDDRQQIYWNAERVRDRRPLRVTRLTGCLMSFSSTAIKAIRFDENLHGACEEDVDFCLQLRPQALFIAPKARLKHNRSPVGRLGDHWLYGSARASWYLFRRHWNRGLRNWFWFLWVNLGYALAAISVMIRDRSFDSLTTLLRAIRSACELTPAKSAPSEP